MGQNTEMQENACRLCEEISPTMHSVFERVPEGQQILHLIREFLRILIYRTDPLSKQICEDCYSNLANFSALKRISYETLDRQRERLEEFGSETNVNIQLYLNSLQEGKYKLDDVFESGSQNKPLPSVDSPLSSSQNAESQSDLDLCDSDLEHSPKIITTHFTRKRPGDDISYLQPTAKKRRFVGPMSRVKQRKEYYFKLLQEEEFKQRLVMAYKPLSLMQCVLNFINSQNVPNYSCASYDNVMIYDHTIPLNSLTDIIESSHDLKEENVCRYCNSFLRDIKELAVHESTHMRIALGEKIDKARIWNQSENDSEVRNKWFNAITNESNEKDNIKNEDINEEQCSETPSKTFDDSSGHVNVLNPEDIEFKDSDETVRENPKLSKYGDSTGIKGEVVLIDTKATVNGVRLENISKEDRRFLYTSVAVNGIKRKFCPLCRYTFKDNWAIESHYFSTACHYTCRFCGIRFNKQRNEFDNHIKRHIMNGDLHTTKIFASRKFQAIPKVIKNNKVKSVAPTNTRTAKLKTLKVKTLVERGPPIIEIKQEPDVELQTPKSQAYFCRKCYQVFFKLDEFNTHVVNCKGSSGVQYPVSYIPKQPPIEKVQPNLEAEKFSPTGRPMRNCVKEIGTYADDAFEEIDERDLKKISQIKSSRGYECGMCNSCFPTFHSRNSHMRIHKAAIQQLKALSKKSPNIVRNQPENTSTTSMEYPNFMEDVKIKQETIEPIVEIHEQPAGNYRSSIGSVSITPIPNSSQRTTLDPKIIKLVQNNPNLTIKSIAEQQRQDTGSSNSFDEEDPLMEADGKCYRCLSCSKPFANKSNLYFHKKNHCSGSKYPCPFCKKRFGTEAAYSSHIFYNHPE